MHVTRFALRMDHSDIYEASFWRKEQRLGGYESLPLAPRRVRRVMRSVETLSRRRSCVAHRACRASVAAMNGPSHRL
jgi:hypothetical protein